MRRSSERIKGFWRSLSRRKVHTSPARRGRVMRRSTPWASSKITGPRDTKRSTRAVTMGKDRVSGFAVTSRAWGRESMSRMMRPLLTRAARSSKAMVSQPGRWGSRALDRASLMTSRGRLTARSPSRSRCRPGRAPGPGAAVRRRPCLRAWHSPCTSCAGCRRTGPPWSAPWRRPRPRHR